MITLELYVNFEERDDFVQCVGDAGATVKNVVEIQHNKTLLYIVECEDQLKSIIINIGFNHFRKGSRSG